MINNILEISTDNKELSCYKGFLRIKEKGDIIKDVPFDSICSLIVTARGVIYTNNLLQNLCENNIPLIILSDNFHPSGILLSLIGQQRQSNIQELQISISKPLQKNLWAEIVKEKIKNQSKLLNLLQKSNPIDKLHSKVLSGDSGNIEAYAARLYFPLLFGNSFIRNHDLNGINSFLNYGYSILRATIARIVVASGLNPSFGIKHHNKLNPFCLVDDLIEPYRPIIDSIVYNIFNGIDDETKILSPEYKKKLAEVIHLEIYNGEGFSELYNIIKQDVWNFVSSVKDKKVKLNYNQYMIKL